MSKLILVVEDDEDNRRAMGTVIRYLLGHQMVFAENGTDAVRLAQQNKPDLILMDLSLPELDGWQATEILRGNEDTKHVPIIAVTAHAMVGDREKALKAGCDDYLTKPVDIDVLAAVIEENLSRKFQERRKYEQTDSGR